MAYMNDNNSPRRPRTYEMQRYVPETCIEKYSFMLIRPPRFTYNEEILNPRRKHKGRYEHHVYCIPFPLSVFTPQSTRYLILYLHGNSSSRYEGYSQLQHLPADVALACFDFAGCGNRSEEDYISLGKKQAFEVDKAVRFLKEKNFKVAVWGRSMGAVSALLSEQSDLLIVDSPFANLKSVSKEISQKVVPCLCQCFFHCVFPCVFMAVSSDVQSKTGVHPEELDVLSKINLHTHRRIMFLAARGDKMINFHHAEQLFQEYNGAHKKLMLFDGTHHSDRPVDVLFQVFAFIDSALSPDTLPGQSKKSDPEPRGEGSEMGEVRSFSLLKEEKGEKQSLEMRSMDNRTSIKIEISSRLVEGGQTEKMEGEKMEKIDEGENDDLEHL